VKLRLRTYTKLIILLSFIISAGLVLFVAYNADSHLRKMSLNNSELYSAYKISELMKSFRSNLIALENKQKTFLVSGDPRFLEEVRAKELLCKSYLRKMEKYFSGKSEEESFYKLKDLTYVQLTESKDLKQNFQGSAAGEDKGSSTMSEIHAEIDLINESLGRTTGQLIDNSVEYVRVSRNWSILEVVFGILISALSLFLLLRDINIRNRLETELKEAKKIAEENANAKERFMANMSHEIRTPMNAVIGFTDLLKKTPLSKQQKEYLDAIHASGSNLMNIINDILDLSKIEAGKLTLEKINFDLGSLFSSLSVMFREKAAQKNIFLEVKKDLGVPGALYGDPTRLTQILVNLVNNAIKFTEKGNVSLSCELKNREHDIAQLVFRVKDTGIGIPADKISGIFERFNQGNKETTRKYGGTGLGLSIVKDLVELQNGDIRVKSKVGAGSEFIVNLSFPVSYQHEEVIPAGSTTLQRLSNGASKVLLADDNELNQRLASTYLKSFGLKVDVATNGEEAVTMFPKTKYDLVLMDIQMPLLDGYQAAKQIREKFGVNTPIIAMTAHMMPGEKEKCASFGMNDYISKPFRESDLHAIVARHLRVPGQPGETGRETTSSATLVDFRDLEEMSRGNKSFMKEMIDLFLDKNPSDLADIESSLKQGDLSTVRSVSHRMKTSLGFMGLKQLNVPLSKMELLAEKGEDTAEINRLYIELAEACELARTELKNVALTL
jgi:signal transduction histidine kinase/DNA-binding response OmpR family regulator